MTLCKRGIGLELRRASELAKPPQHNQFVDVGVTDIHSQATLNDIALCRDQSFNFQRLADVPETAIRAMVQVATAASLPVVSARSWKSVSSATPIPEGPLRRW